MSPLLRRSLFVLCLGVLVSGCALEGRRAVKPSELRGWVLSEPLPKVDFTLESMWRPSS